MTESNGTSTPEAMLGKPDLTNSLTLWMEKSPFVKQSAAFSMPLSQPGLTLLMQLCRSLKSLNQPRKIGRQPNVQCDI